MLVITIAGAALGLDALTAPPPELKQKIAAGSNAPKPRQIPIDRPPTQSADNAGKTQTPAQPAAPIVAQAAPPTTTTTTAATTGIAPAAMAAATPAEAAPAPANPATPPQAQPAVQAAAVTPAPTPTPTPTPQPVAAPATAAPVQTASAPAASCNIQLCAATYRSFRESDCTYQPFQGERRVCERTAQDNQDTVAVSRPPEPRNEWTARSDNRRDSALSRRDVELRAVERRVRQITDDELLDEPVYVRPSRRVIVVERPDGRGDYVTQESYSRRWQSPGWR